MPKKNEKTVWCRLGGLSFASTQSVLILFSEPWTYRKGKIFGILVGCWECCIFPFWKDELWGMEGVDVAIFVCKIPSKKKLP